MKTNWEFINHNRITKENRQRVHPSYWSTPEDGLNGMFVFLCEGHYLRVIASDGGGWTHISVTRIDDRRTPTWQMMSKVKELFIGDEDWAIQFHPPRSEYVNNHDGCLHIWVPQNAPLPTPPSWMVGIKAQARPEFPSQPA